MENSPNSIEVQIDSFLEHFKKSASKAMDGDWTSSTTLTNRIVVIEPSLKTTTTANILESRSRTSLLDISELSDNNDETIEGSQTTPTAITTSSSSIATIKQQYLFKNQSSTNNIELIETDLHQSVQNSNLYISNIFQSCNSSNDDQSEKSISFDRKNSMPNICQNQNENMLNIADVADLLHIQHAIITGGRSKNGCPLIIFPDNNNFQTLQDYEYRKLILYLTSVPSMQDADLGFHLLIDRRKDKWASVKAVLLKISNYFPGIIHVVYVLRPSGFLQKAISEVSSKLFKEEFRFRLIICSTLEDLYEHVDRSHLTQDMGGILIYSHHEWIQQRISFEKFSNLTHQVSADLDEFIQTIHDTELPNSVEATLKLLNEQGSEYKKLKDEILSAAKHGEGLLENVKSNNDIKEFSERTGNVSSIERAGNINRLNYAQQYDDCCDYRRLLVQLEETERRFDEFWNTHHTRLKQCLELRKFEHDFKELQTNFDVHLKIVSEMTEIGETVTSTDSLIKKTQEYHKICCSDIKRAEKVISNGKQLINFNGTYPKEIIQPKCEELLRVCDIINNKLIKRLEILDKNRELMERIEKASMWCAKGVELLASQRIEKCSVSIDIAEQSLQEIQQFMSSSSEFQLLNSTDFKNMFQESVTPETKALVSQVLQRISDVSMMCDTRTQRLKKLTLKIPKPVQTVTPEPALPLQPPVGAPYLFRHKTHSKVDSHEILPRSVEESIDFGLSINDNIGSNADVDISGQNIQNQVDFETRKLKRGHVLTELLETERIYVSEISSILKGYRDAMFSQEMIPLVPSSLQGKEDILFGNLEELYTFHSEIFLKDLENCISTTELVALCFVQRRDTFYRLYSFYCQNIPRSERLRETLVDTHLFLQECQKRLGHKLPLAAYLLKPVQRITKYQLLLKDLLKFSDSRTCTKELQKALDCMLIVLKCVNDSMHQIAITGFPTDLSQQGELLLQDSFQIWTESKKDIRLRLKTQHRHIFLYQKAMLFCKQSSKTGHNKSTYQFKHYLKMSQIGLTESVRGDSRRFEVWLQGRQEVHTLQAPNIETKNKWVSEIKRVLLNQLRELKGEKIKQYGLSHRKLRETMSCDTPCLLSTPQRTISCDGTNNDHTIMNRMPSTTSIVNKSSTNECQIQSISPVGINSLTLSDKDIQEVGGWSSDYSNSEDELSVAEENNIPGNRFIALADYCAVGHSEVSMKEGDIIELLKIGCAGWWFVKILDSNVEGWTPAAYLELINRKSSRSSSRNQDQINWNEKQINN